MIMAQNLRRRKKNLSFCVTQGIDREDRTVLIIMLSETHGLIFIFD